MSKSTKDVLLLMAGIIIAVILLMLYSTSSSEPDEYRCSNCDRVFTNRTDVRSITRTKMCEPCYENHKTIQSMIDESRKYIERNQ